MLSVDTNILFPHAVQGAPGHAEAVAFLEPYYGREGLMLSEFVLMELYGLLRNPTVIDRPLSAREAADVCSGYRSHPLWPVVSLPAGGRAFHDALWAELGTLKGGRRRAYDLRAARSLQAHGVTEFATVNIRDFQGLGFRKVWNPLV